MLTTNKGVKSNEKRSESNVLFNNYKSNNVNNYNTNVTVMNNNINNNNRFHSTNKKKPSEIFTNFGIGNTQSKKK